MRDGREARGPLCGATADARCAEEQHPVLDPGGAQIVEHRVHPLELVGTLSEGVLLEDAVTLFPDASDRRALMWDTPRRLFGFAS